MRVESMKVTLRSPPALRPRDIVSVVATGAILRHARSVTLRLSRCLFDALGRSAGLCLKHDIPPTAQGVEWARQRCPPAMHEVACVAYANGRDNEAVGGLTVHAVSLTIVAAIVLNTYGAGRYATAEQIQRVTVWALVAGGIAAV